MSTEKYNMILKRPHSFQDGVIAVKLISTICILAFGGLCIAGFQMFQLWTLNQDDHKLRSAINAQLQSISIVRIPDTEVAITTQVSTILDSIKAQYEPHHIQVNIEKASQRLTVQVWYWRPHRALFIENPKMFYAAAEKIGFLEIVEQQSTLMPASTRVADANSSASPKKPPASVAPTPKKLRSPPKYRSQRHLLSERVIRLQLK
jgi:hypothetical protein